MTKGALHEKTWSYGIKVIYKVGMGIIKVMERNGTERSGMERNRMERDGMEWNRTEPNGNMKVI